MPYLGTISTPRIVLMKQSHGEQNQQL